MKTGSLTSAAGANIRLNPVYLADSFLSRTRGLLFRPCPQLGSGLLITRCSSIHTVGMGYGIDVVFLDRSNVIARIHHDVKPWRMRMCNKASKVLELGGGHARRLGLEEGMQLEWTP